MPQADLAKGDAQKDVGELPMREFRIKVRSKSGNEPIIVNTVAGGQDTRFSWTPGVRLDLLQVFNHALVCRFVL